MKIYDFHSSTSLAIHQMCLELGQSLLEVVSWPEEPKEQYLVAVREGGLHITRYVHEHELKYHFTKFNM